MEAHRADFGGEEPGAEVNSVELDGFNLHSSNVDTVGFDSYEDPVPKVKETDSVDSLDKFLREIGRYSLLTAEEEVMYAKQIEVGIQTQEQLDEFLFGVYAPMENELLELYELVEQGRLAKETMINSNLRLVVSIAKRYRSSGVPFLDLIQEGTLGLNRAVEKFDYTRGHKFSTYATWWIRQAVTRAIADKARVVRFPVHVVEKLRKIYNAQDNLAKRYNRDPLPEEIASELGFSEEEVIDLINLPPDPTSLDLPVGEGDSVFGDLLEDDKADDPEEEAVIEERKAKLNEALDNLGSRGRLVLEMRYGLNGHEPSSLEDIGKIVGVTRERVRQIENRVLRELEASETTQGLREARNQ